MSTQEIPESLFEDGWLDGIEHVVSSGKEGTVWCCSCSTSTRINADYVAVKVYRPRSTRSFKNDSVYVQGRSFGVALNGSTGIARSARRTRPAFEPGHQEPVPHWKDGQ